MPQSRQRRRELWRESAGHRAHLAQLQRNHVARHPHLQCVRAACGRARRDGSPYDRAHLRTMPCPDVCPVLGTPIRFAYKEGKRPPENTASFDRIDPGIGYVRGNVRIISLLANQMKSSATPAQLEAFARWVLYSSPRSNHTEAGTHDDSTVSQHYPGL